MQFKVAQCYGRALFEMADEKGELERIAEDIGVIDTVLSQIPDTKQFFSSPLSKISELRKIMEMSFKPTVHELTWNFLELLIVKKRLNALKWIPLVYRKLYNEHFGIVEIKIEACYQLTKKEKTYLIKKLEKITSKKVLLNFELNKHLIAGFNVFIGEKLKDCSIAGKLQQLRQRMLAA